MRAWFVAEIFFALASSWALLLAPQATETNFAWPIQPVVTAAVFGAIYFCALLLMLAGFFTRIWERVRVIVLPSAAFTAVMLMPTFLHLGPIFDRVGLFAHLARELCAAAAGLCRMLHLATGRSQPVGSGVTQPAADDCAAFLFVNGAALAVFSIAVMLFRRSCRRSLRSPSRR